jgi:hypothetical protein
MYLWHLPFSAVRLYNLVSWVLPGNLCWKQWQEEAMAGKVADLQKPMARVERTIANIAKHEVMPESTN